VDAAGKRKTLLFCSESNPEFPIVKPLVSPIFWLDYLALCILSLNIFKHIERSSGLNLPKNKTGHAYINVTLRRLHLTTVVVDKQ
jgi:hypothetical protein